MLKRLTTAATLAACLAAATLLAPAPAAIAQSASASAMTSGGKLDRVIFLSGRVIEGEIVEELDDKLVMMVRVGSLPPTRATYLLSDILKIEHDVVARADADDMDADDEEEEPAKKEWDPDAALIYVMELEGLFGSDISRTPIEDALADVNETFGDLIRTSDPSSPVDHVVDPEVRDRHILVIKMDCESDPRQSYNAVFAAEELGPLFEREIQDRGRKVVFWIKGATDGASFLPWLSEHIYFHPEGRMWFQRDLENFSSGDDMVDEKLISARLGHYHGFAIDGGYGEHGDEIINAMARSRYWLSYRLVGGKAQLSEREYTDEMEADGWILLTDNGKGANEDKDNKILRDFNDRLILDARIAQILGVSKGMVETNADLAYQLGVGRNYEIVEGNSEEIFEDWVDRKEAAFRQINPNPTRQNPLGELWEKFNDIKVAGTYYEQKRARTSQIATLRKIRGLVKTFEEVWDPDGSFVADLNVRIDQIKKQQQLANAAFRAR